MQLACPRLGCGVNSSLYRVVVITDSQTADGFRLAGVDVRVADTPDGAQRELSRLVDDDTTGIVALNQTFMSAIDDRLRRKIDSSYRPIVVPMPVRAELVGEESHAAYLSRLIRRAVGFDITLRCG